MKLSSESSDVHLSDLAVLLFHEASVGSFEVHLHFALLVRVIPQVEVAESEVSVSTDFILDVFGTPRVDQLFLEVVAC